MRGGERKNDLPTAQRPPPGFVAQDEAITTQGDERRAQAQLDPAGGTGHERTPLAEDDDPAEGFRGAEMHPHAGVVLDALRRGAPDFDAGIETRRRVRNPSVTYDLAPPHHAAIHAAQI